MSSNIKICYKCNFTGNGLLFHGKQCKKCANRKRTEKVSVKLGKLFPAIRGSQTKLCKKCGILKHKDVFRGRSCKKCFNYSRISINLEQDLKDRTKKYKNKSYIKKKNDVSFKIRLNLSSAIRKSLKKNGSSKNKLSILNFLPYTITELKLHIESQFESWMTWKNHGK